jgi:hypothetical protein
MEVTEKLARYILSLQSVSELEIGTQPEDVKVRKQLEREFPVLMEEREDRELRDWLWAVKVERDQRVVEVWTKFEKLTAEWESADLETRDYREHSDRAGKVVNELMAVKITVLQELLAEDQVLLEDEWRKEKHGSGDKI